MKSGIHPDYKPVRITCACGNTIETKSTLADYTVDICSACHPVYSGAEERLVDSAGRVERFRRKYGNAAAK